MEFADLAERFGGWLALLLYFLYNKFWPLMEKQIVPSKLAANMNILEFEQQLELRRQETNEKIAESLQEYAIGMTTTNERIEHILQNQTEMMEQHRQMYELVSDGLTDMRAVTGKQRRRIDEKETNNG